MANGQILDVVSIGEISDSGHLQIFFAQQIDDEASNLKFGAVPLACEQCTARLLFGCLGPEVFDRQLTELDLKIGPTKARLNRAIIPPGYLKTCLKNMGIPDFETEA